MDYSLPGSSVHGIFQARVLEWGDIAFSDAKKERKTIEWERLEISSIKFEIPRKLFMQKDGHNKGQKWYRPNRSRRY